MRPFSVYLIAIIATFNCVRSNAQTPQATELAERAVNQSQLTLHSSTPFHLKASIAEVTNPDSEYKGELEEYWVSSEKYRRTITSPNFSQTLIVNGDKVFEDDKGDYFPWWLNDLTRAVVEPLPLSVTDVLKNSNPQLGFLDFRQQGYCFRMETKVGTPPVVNKEVWSFCFDGKDGLLKSVVTPGFSAEFEDFSNFKDKHVARGVYCTPEPGTTIGLKVLDLDELKNPDEGLFAVKETTPFDRRIASVSVPEAVVKTLVQNTPDILWPTVRSGQTKGVLSVFVSIDREGHIREAWPLGSDNAGLEDPAREQVKKWQLKTAMKNGVPIQVESVLTFRFDTRIADPIPTLSNEEGRKLATNVVEPDFPPGTPKGAELKVQVGISPDGTMSGVANPYNVPTPQFAAAYRALTKWQFRPCMRDGKPDACSADIIFRVP